MVHKVTKAQRLQDTGLMLAYVAYSSYDCKEGEGDDCGHVVTLFRRDFILAYSFRNMLGEIT